MPSETSKQNQGYYLRLRTGPPDLEICTQMAGEMKIPHLLSILLWQRGITTASEATAFFNPSLANLPSPFAMKDMDRAVSLVAQAVREQWPICIHGDYDVDGISSSALLALFFQRLGIQPICYQPDRLTEGYGVQEKFIQKNAPGKGKPSLFITVDCGISAVKEVEFARKMGFKVIVTDHHEPPQQLPAADAILNPKQHDCPFPYQDLAGVGVAFFLALGIRTHLVEHAIIAKEQAPNLKQFMDLVALGTVADVMPVTGINRILIRAGLEVMNAQASPWVSALRQMAGSQEGPLTTEDISFRLAPRINAPGRLGKPHIAFSLLTCADPVVALELANSIEAMNQERRQLESESLDFVFSECERLAAKGDHGFVIYGNFHPGVIGIIASRVAERFHRPAIIMTDDWSELGRIKGSGRSINGVNLYEVLQACAEPIIQFGGHQMAAGLTITKENLPIFTERFNEILSLKASEKKIEREFVIDYRPKPEEVLDEYFLLHYYQLEPFGNGNPEPVFLLTKPLINNSGTIKNHLKYTLEVNGTAYRGIGFNLAEKLQLLRDEHVHLAIKIRNTVFRGMKRTEVHTVDVFQLDEIGEYN